MGKKNRKNIKFWSNDAKSLLKTQKANQLKISKKLGQRQTEPKYKLTKKNYGKMNRFIYNLWDQYLWFPNKIMWDKLFYENNLSGRGYFSYFTCKKQY